MVIRQKQRLSVDEKNLSVDPANNLTPRQLEVLALLCEGLPNKLISRRLDIASGTVKVHVVQILRTLGVSSRLQAVVEARRLGLVDMTYNMLPMQATASALAQGSVQRQAGSGDEVAPWRGPLTGRSLVTA